MGHEVVSIKRLIADDDMDCDAYWVLTAGSCLDEYVAEMTWSQKKRLVMARRDNYQIKKGQKYIEQIGNYDCERYTSRCRPDLRRLATQLNAWEE